MSSGTPAPNQRNHIYYFVGRSDNFDLSQLSTNPNNARMDPEAVRMLNDGRTVFISDEYGPSLYQLDRITGKRIRSVKLPDNLAISKLNAQKLVETDTNTAGRTNNKEMEGLAITPDRRMLVGIMQANLLHDQKKSLRIVTIDVRASETHEYAYKLTDGSGVSEIYHHQFLVDERKVRGMADLPLSTDTALPAVIKKLLLIDLDRAQDVTEKSGDLSDYAVSKPEFLDVIGNLAVAGISPS